MNPDNDIVESYVAGDKELLENGFTNTFENWGQKFFDIMIKYFHVKKLRFRRLIRKHDKMA